MLAPRDERQSVSARQEPAEGAHGFDERRTHNVGHLGLALGQVGANAQAARGFRWPSRGAAATASGRRGLDDHFPFFRIAWYCTIVGAICGFRQGVSI